MRDEINYLPQGTQFSEIHLKDSVKELMKGIPCKYLYSCANGFSINRIYFIVGKGSVQIMEQESGQIHFVTCEQ